MLLPYFQKALKIACEKSAVCKVIQGSLRKEDADIPEYLFSRAVAGDTLTIIDCWNIQHISFNQYD